jgi:hypothetical protein
MKIADTPSYLSAAIALSECHAWIVFSSIPRTVVQNASS